jgi:hypothetical protein
MIYAALASCAMRVVAPFLARHIDEATGTGSMRALLLVPRSGRQPQGMS